MNNSNNLENKSGITKEIERQKALKTLAKAKLLNRKVVFLDKGASGHVNPNILF